MFRALPLLLLIACATVGGVQTANTAGQGTLQIAAEPGLQVLAGKPAIQLYPHFDVAVRYGFTDRLDLGLRAGWSFLETQGKYQLTGPANKKFVVSLAPTVGGVVQTSTGVDVLGAVLTASTPVLFGIGAGVHQLVLGVRSQHFIFIGNGAPLNMPTYLLAVGGSIGFALRFSDALTLLPELAAVWPVYGGLPVTRTDGVNADFLYGAAHIGIWQLKLGFILDRKTGFSPKK